MATQVPAHAHEDFLRLFHSREAKLRGKPAVDALNNAQHAALRKKLESIHFIPPVWSLATQKGVVDTAKRWESRYCNDQNLGDWQTVLLEAGESIKSIAMDFLLWICERSAVRSYGTTWVYFRQFKQLFVLCTRKTFPQIVTLELRKWHKKILVPRFNLQPPNFRDQPVLDADDLHALLIFNIAFDRGTFPNERHPILTLPGICQALSGTGARPAEFVYNEKKIIDRGKVTRLSKAFDTEEEMEDDEALDEDSRKLRDLLTQETTGRGRPKCLCYEDINLMVVRDPVGGGNSLATQVKLIHHKGVDRKPKPTIYTFPQAKRPIFCFINTIIVSAIADGAFAASAIKSPAQVYQLEPKANQHALPLRWKREWLKRPVFRSCKSSPEDQDTPLPYSKLCSDLKRQSLEAGFENHITPRAFRRGVSNAVNGQTSDAVRDQIMRHDPKWATFNSAYINQRVKFDVQSAFLNEPTEDSLIELLGHMSLTKDPAARRYMVPQDVWDALPIDPEILALENRRDQLKDGRYAIQDHPQQDYTEEFWTFKKFSMSQGCYSAKTVWCWSSSSSVTGCKGLDLVRLTFVSSHSWLPEFHLILIGSRMAMFMILTTK
ncbi:uncharacterized protein B0I36DRAFT_257829 [Microdochium trichocladiopsis]|uniref:Uncharacterized protein n=1 Tax=Microdochium trichocladiopsis TaxID=1682393 RepID=A0A9P8XPP4_9PEZI|nr:uncharacterized protein B0I36DRAFT_257829 [Microdochium trichocladiopsis]KAH7009443.1 hypothetical protein B0I36DRAFT_257829 [Microdochium trichocladiopsis]